MADSSSVVANVVTNAVDASGNTVVSVVTSNNTTSTAVTANLAAGAIGLTGATGPAGSNGVGVPTGGTTNQVLAKTSNTDYATAWVNAASGSGSVTNVSSADSNATVTNPATT